MPKPELEDLAAIHLKLYARDIRELRVLYEDNIGVSMAVRKLVREFLRTLEKRLEGERKNAANERSS